MVVEENEEVVEVYEPDDGYNEVSDTMQGEPFYKGIFDAIDNEESRSYFLQMLGYVPRFDRHGRVIGYQRVKKPDFDDQLMGFLSSIRSGKVMGLAHLEGVDPLTPLEVEWTVEQIIELIQIQAPPDTDLTPYLVPTEWAKLEMKKHMTLANRGKLVNAVLGTPYIAAESPVVAEAPGEREERKHGLLGKLLGRG